MFSNNNVWEGTEGQESSILMKLKRLQIVAQTEGNILVVVMTDSDAQSNDYQLLDDQVVRREKNVELSELPQFIVVLTEARCFSGLYKRIESVDEIKSSLIDNCATAYCWKKVY